MIFNFNIESNWLGVAKVKLEESKNYCNVALEKNQIIDVVDKEQVDGKNYKAFVGLCFIKDYKIFWKGLNSKILIDGELQISNGIKYLIENKNTIGVKINWTDVGDKEKYEKTLKKYTNYDFSKTNETLYILNNRVIKFFADPKIIELRTNKSKLNKSVFPKIDQISDQFYSYKFQTGKLFTNIIMKNFQLFA